MGYQIARPLRRFKKLSRDQAKEEVLRLLRVVKLDGSYYDRLPRQLSGGQKQGVAIARAIAAHPDLVLCDEPVSALDVSVQACILNLLLDLRPEFGITMVFISHDLGVVRHFSDYVAVMYLGKVWEIGPAEAIYNPPYHPYTEALLAAVPLPDPSVEQKHVRLSDNVPSPLNSPAAAGSTRAARARWARSARPPSRCAWRPPPSTPYIATSHWPSCARSSRW